MLLSVFILLRCLAMADSACAPITHGTISLDADPHDDAVALGNQVVDNMAYVAESGLEMAEGHPQLEREGGLDIASGDDSEQVVQALLLDSVSLMK